MAYDEYRDRNRFDRANEFRGSEFGSGSRRGIESRWPGESSWGYGREYDEGYSSPRPLTDYGRTTEFERSEFTRGAPAFRPQTTRYGTEGWGRGIGWEPQGGFGQGPGYLYGWRTGEQGFQSPTYRTPERWRSYSGAWLEPRYGYGTYPHLSDIPRGRFTGRGPKGYQRSDERIREDVSEDLSQSGDIDASEIEVRVTNCVVTLDGEVETREEKRLAEDIAEAAPGVRDVHNNLKVKKGFFARVFGSDEEEEERKNRSLARESR